jgi:hypothetical protein
MYTQPLIQRTPGVISIAVKRLRRKADHSPPSSAKVNNGGAITPFLNMSSWGDEVYLKGLWKTKKIAVTIGGAQAKD